MKNIALLFIIIVGASCQQPTMEHGISADEELVTAQIESPPVKARQEEVMERNIEMMPIPGAMGYLFSSGVLRGILNGDYRPDIAVIHPAMKVNRELRGISLDQFFSIEGVLYFSITDRWMDENEEQQEQVHKFSQPIGGAPVEIEGDLPEVPAMERTEGTFGTFEFSVYDWEGELFNKIMRDGSFLVSVSSYFDSVLLLDKGIIWSQPENVCRNPGVWFYGNDQCGGPSWIKEYSRIWK